MNSKEIIIILNRIKDVATDEVGNSKLTLTNQEVKNLFSYLKGIKKQHEKDIELIKNIQIQMLQYFNK